MEEIPIHERGLQIEEQNKQYRQESARMRNNLEESLYKFVPKYYKHKKHIDKNKQITPQ